MNNFDRTKRIDKIETEEDYANFGYIFNQVDLDALKPFGYSENVTEDQLKTIYDKYIETEFSIMQISGKYARGVRRKIDGLFLLFRNLHEINQSPNPLMKRIINKCQRIGR